MDLQLLEDLARFVEWEKDPTWAMIPLDPAEARSMHIAPQWLPALTGQATTATRILRLWSGAARLMPRTCTVFSEKAIGLALLRTQACPASLVYIFEAGGELAARRGYLPAKELPLAASAFPIDLTPLYQIHDGLVNFMSYDGGPLPVQQWRTLVEQDTGEPSLVKIATDGTEAFGFDLSESPSQGYVVRPNDDEVVRVDDAWAFLDDLVASRIEDF